MLTNATITKISIAIAALTLLGCQSVERRQIRGTSLSSGSNDGQGLGIADFDPAKTIFTFWDKGEADLLKNRPLEAQVLEEWRHVQKEKDGWKIVVVDNVPGSPNNIHTLIDAHNEKVRKEGHPDRAFNMWSVEDIEKRNIGLPDKKAQAYSDVVRIALLDAFGGTWMDNSIILANSLDNIFLRQLQDQSGKSMAAFINPTQGLVENKYNDSVESWFLAAKKNSRPIHAWRKNVWDYIEKSPEGKKTKILDHEMFQGDDRVRRSVKAIFPPRFREYLWFFNVWKKTIIENPGLANEMIVRNADSLSAGPIGHEYSFTANSPAKNGMDAFEGKFLGRITNRLSKNQYPTMIKLAGSNAQDIRKKYNKLGQEAFTNSKAKNLFTELRKIAAKKSKGKPSIMQDDEAFHDYQTKLARILKGDSDWWPADGTLYAVYFKARQHLQYREGSLKSLIASATASISENFETIQKDFESMAESFNNSIQRLETMRNEVLDSSEGSSEERGRLIDLIESTIEQLKDDVKRLHQHREITDVTRQQYLQSLKSVELTSTTQNIERSRIDFLKNAGRWVLGISIGAGVTFGSTKVYEQVQKWRDNRSEEHEVEDEDRAEQDEPIAEIEEAID